MKKIKQILAIITIVILVGLYITTFVLAISGFDGWWNMFMASLGASIMLPVLIWLFLRMAEVFSKDKDEEV